MRYLSIGRNSFGIADWPGKEREDAPANGFVEGRLFMEPPLKRRRLPLHLSLLGAAAPLLRAAPKQFERAAR